MEKIKEEIKKSPALRPVNHGWDIYLAVDTSYKAVGWYIYQVDPERPKQ